MESELGFCAISLYFWTMGETNSWERLRYATLAQFVLEREQIYSDYYVQSQLLVVFALDISPTYSNSVYIFRN